MHGICDTNYLNELSTVLQAGNTLISSFTYKDTDAQKSFSTCSSLVQGSIPDSNWWTNSVKCFVWQQVSAHLGLLSVSSAHRCNACLLGLSTVTHRSHMLYSLKHSRRIYPGLLFLLHNFSCRFGLSLAHTSFPFLCKLRTFPFHLKKTLYNSLWHLWAASITILAPPPH